MCVSAVLGTGEVAIAIALFSVAAALLKKTWNDGGVEGRHGVRLAVGCIETYFLE